MSLLSIFFNCHIVAFFKASVLKEVRILRYLLDNNAVLRHAFLYKQHFYKPRLKLEINQAKATPCCFYYLNIIHILHQRYHPKIVEHILKNKQKSKFIYIYDIIRLTITRMKMKMKSKPCRYDINRHRSRCRHKYSKYNVFQYDDAYVY